jgi:hypothetical protein
MAVVTGLTLVKRFEYRGDPNEEFSNSYHFKNNPPSDDPSWLQLTNDVVAIEQKAMSPQVTYVRCYGYNDNDPNAHHVFVHDWDVSGSNPVGTGAWVNANPFSGDQASVVEWRLDRLSKRGKPIYLRKYFHHGAKAADPDALAADYMTALDTFAKRSGGIGGHWGGLRSRAQDDNWLDYKVIPWVTTRTLKRRGKRPLTGN